MTDLLPTLGALTLGGSIVVGVLAFFSRSTRSRYAGRCRCWAWLLLCLRLAIPVSLLPQVYEAAQPLIQLPAPSNTVVYEYSRPPLTSEPQASSSQDRQNSTQPDGSQAPVLPPAAQIEPQIQPSAPAQEKSESFTLSLTQILALIWLAGVVIMVLWALVSHLRFLAFLRRWARLTSDPETVRIFNQLGDQLRLNRRPHLMTCPGLRTPMLAGLFRPVLLLPEESLEENTLRYSLLHELTHFRRRDIWLKTLALWVNAVHWFNPLIWYMVCLVERDTELACDEDALRRLPPEEHAAYGRTILAAAKRLKPNNT